MNFEVNGARATRYVAMVQGFLDAIGDLGDRLTVLQPSTQEDVTFHVDVDGHDPELQRAYLAYMWDLAMRLEVELQEKP